MVEGNPDVTLDTLHGDLAELRGEMRAGFSDLKVTVVAGFAGMPTRDQTDEMVRLLREGNRLQEHRFTQLEGYLHALHGETQQVLHALADSQRSLSVDIKALVARIDALIRGRDNGQPGA
jgi:hypothetical protein